MRYQIWSEGYLTSGMDFPAEAKMLGEVEAESFVEACDKLLGGDPYYDGLSHTYWGCRLFDNELYARKSFG